MKLIQVVNARKALMEALSGQKLSFSLSYKIAKFMEFTDEDNKFFAENFRKTAEEHGTIDGDTYKIPTDKIDEFNKKIEELGNTEVDVRLEFTEADFSALNVTVEQATYLMPLIDK